MIISGDVAQFLKAQNRDTLDRLYAQPTACLAVLRLLAALPQQLVFRLLHVQTIALGAMQAWIHPAHPHKITNHLEMLASLGIMEVSAGIVTMNPQFQLGLHNALTGASRLLVARGAESSDGISTILDEFALDAWNNILYSLVGTASRKLASKTVETLLVRSGLMGNTGGALRITSTGFQFLLLDLNLQVWVFLLEYISLAKEKGWDIVHVLGFLFQLGTLDFGQEYSTEGLNPTLLLMIVDLKQMGLVYQRKNSRAENNSQYFYPTRLATNLTCGTLKSFDSETSEASKGFILLETNYRIYAYTDSPIQIAILSLFCTMRARFTNMVQGLITRDSAREAFSNGITADQIISYITTHAHPEMKTQKPILPSTVVDQIKLWEMDRNRLKTCDGFLYQMFDRFQHYQEVLDYATGLDVVVWHSDDKCMLFVTAEGHAMVKECLKRKQSSASEDRLRSGDTVDNAIII